MNSTRTTALTVLVFGLCVSGRQASAKKPRVRSLFYNAARATTPDKQGFTAKQRGKNPPAIVKNGILQQGPTSKTGGQWWETDGVPLDFGAAASGMNAEWTVRVDESQFFYRWGHIRTGWHASFADRHHRFFLVFVGKERVILINSDPDTRPAIEKFKTGGRFHHFRFVVDDEVGMLFVDGAKQPLVSKPVGKPNRRQVEKNRVYFGEGTQFVGGKFAVKQFFYANDAGRKSPFHP